LLGRRTTGADDLGAHNQFVSVGGGGKFANGAITGVFGYMFNYLVHVDGLPLANNRVLPFFDPLIADSFTNPSDPVHFYVDPSPGDKLNRTNYIAQQQALYSMWTREGTRP
jgi:hypothetical protein